MLFAYMQPCNIIYDFPVVNVYNYCLQLQA